MFQVLNNQLIMLMLHDIHQNPKLLIIQRILMQPAQNQILQWHHDPKKHTLTFWKQHSHKPSIHPTPQFTQQIIHGDWQQLSQFILSGCQIDDEKLRDIVGICCENLEMVDLSDNMISEVGIGFLVTNGWHKLTKLNIGSNPIGKEGLKKILQREYQQLRQLRLSKIQITAVGLAIIPQYNLQNIMVLMLNDNKLGVMGLNYLMKSNLANLTELSLNACELGDQGFIQLHKNNWKTLRWVSLMQNNNKHYTCFNYLYANKWKQLKYMQLGTNETVIGIEYLNFIAMQSSKIMIYCCCDMNEDLFSQTDRILRDKYQD